MFVRRIALAVAWGWLGTATAEVIAISSLANGADYGFSPKLAKLAYYNQKTEVNGWDPRTQMFLRTAGGEEPYLNVNPGTTQYQGHYVWLTNKVVSGFGTYTSSKRSRSFGWVFRNDTGKALRVAEMSVVYGQWGARNSRPDTLAFDCRVSENFPDLSASEGWLASAADAFTTPYTNNAPGASFPCFERRRLETRSGPIPNKAYFAVRFTDTCPPSGNNAHLGIAELNLRFVDRRTGFSVFVR